MILNTLKKFIHHMRKNGLLFLRLFPYFWGDDRRIRRRFILVVLFLILGIALNLAVPLSLRFVIASFEQNAAPFYIITTVLLAYGLIWMSSQFVVSMREISMVLVLERAVRRLNLRLLDTINILSIRQHTNRKTGALTNALEKAQRALQVIILGVVFITVPTLLELVIAAGIVWSFYGVSYSLVFLSVLISFIFFSVLGAQKALVYRQESNAQHREVSSNLVDNLLNLEIVHYFGNQIHELESYDRALQQKETLEVKALTFMELLHMGQVLILGVGFTVLILMVGYGIAQGDMKVSDFVLINGLALQFFVPLSIFGNVFRESHQAFVDLEYVFSLLDAGVTQEKEPHHHQAMQITEGKIVFEQVKFGYEKNQPILQEVSFSIEPGQTVAIVGETGAGKSTIIKLLYRFYTVNSGLISIDGHDLRHTDQQTLAKVLGIVPQDTILFNNTIAYNISYGKLDATQQQIEQAAYQAQLHEFIVSLPKGYATTVGERGIKLSGGEKQRIAIARLLLKDPLIYLFDEATASLDAKTEHLIQQQIDNISRNKTTLIITHKLANVLKADMIYVLYKGRIIEQGQHQALLAKQGYYYELHLKQQKTGQ